jgi:polar amino acid transport system substrate-binding protein
MISGLYFIGVSHAEKTICLTSCNWEPYVGETLPDLGFTSEILVKAFERVGYKVKIEIYPWKRAMEITREGKCDALYSAYYTEERAATYAISDPYIQGEVYLCTKKDRDISYKSLRDLSAYKIGVVMGYANSPEFDSADYLKKDEATSDLVNLKKLIKDRVDLIAIDRYVAIHHLKTSSFFVENAGDVKFLEPPLQSSPVHVMFSKASPAYKKHLADFNKGLKEIKKEGTFDKIMRKHGFIISDNNP